MLTLVSLWEGKVNYAYSTCQQCWYPCTNCNVPRTWSWSYVVHTLTTFIYTPVAAEIRSPTVKRISIRVGLMITSFSWARVLSCAIVVSDIFVRFLLFTTSTRSSKLLFNTWMARSCRLLDLLWSTVAPSIGVFIGL